MIQLFWLLIGTALTSATGLNDVTWVYRAVAEPLADGTPGVEEAWKPVHRDEYPYNPGKNSGFSLVRQRMTEGMPHPFASNADSELLRAQDWELATVFLSSKPATPGIEIHFQRLSPFSEIYLNGILIGRTSHALKTDEWNGLVGPWIFPIGQALREGRNELLIRLLAVEPEAVRRHAALTRNLPDGPAVTVRVPRAWLGTEVAPAVPGCEVILGGIMTPTLGGALRNKGRLNQGGQTFAELTLESFLPQTFKAEVRDSSKNSPLLDQGEVTQTSGVTETGRIEIRPGMQKIIRRLAQAPEANWKLGQVNTLEDLGRNFNSLTLNLIPEDIEKDLGFSLSIELPHFRRTTKLDPGNATRPAALMTPSGRVAIRGITLVPTDLALPNREVNQAAYIRRAADAGFNLVRYWGGAGYPSAEVLQACDLAGIALWVELPFVRGLFPGDETFANAAGEEVDSALRLLQNHPCVVAVSGSSETAAYRTLEQAPGLRHARETQEVVAEQVRLFDERLRTLVMRRLPDVTYLPYGETLGSGDMTLRMFASAPSPATASKWKLGNGLRWAAGREELELGRRLGQEGLNPADVGALAFASRWLQAEDLRNQLDRLRLKGPEHGAVLWHFNDAWPGTTQSLIDVEGVDKPAFFVARRGLSPEGVRLSFEGASAQAQSLGKALDLSLRLLDAAGQPLQVHQGPGPLKGTFPPGAVYAVAENGPHRIIRPLPWAYRLEDPKLKESNYSIEGDKNPSLGFLSTLTIHAKGVVIGLCLEPTQVSASAQDGLVDMLPGERHDIRVQLPPGTTDWRQAFKARSWHDLQGP